MEESQVLLNQWVPSCSVHDRLLFFVFGSSSSFWAPLCVIFNVILSLPPLCMSQETSLPSKIRVQKEILYQLYAQNNASNCKQSWNPLFYLFTYSLDGCLAALFSGGTAGLCHWCDVTSMLVLILPTSEGWEAESTLPAVNSTSQQGLELTTLSLRS